MITNIIFIASSSVLYTVILFQFKKINIYQKKLYRVAENLYKNLKILEVIIQKLFLVKAGCKNKTNDVDIDKQELNKPVLSKFLN